VLVHIHSALSWCSGWYVTLSIPRSGDPIEDFSDLQFLLQSSSQIVSHGLCMHVMTSCEVIWQGTLFFHSRNHLLTQEISSFSHSKVYHVMQFQVGPWWSFTMQWCLLDIAYRTWQCSGLAGRSYLKHLPLQLLSCRSYQKCSNHLHDGARLAHEHRYHLPW